MVRDASEADARGMAEVQVAAWRAAYRGIVQPQLLEELSVGAREEVWREVIAGGGMTLVAGDENDVVEGYCSLILPSRDEDAGDRTAEIAATYVDPARWGQGVGGSLLREALARLGTGRWDDVTLWVFRRNAQGRAFYARSGFRLDGATGSHQPSGVATARMRLPLGGTL